MRLLEELEREFAEYVLLDMAAPMDLIVRMQEQGLVPDQMVETILLRHINES
jgi:hypothetical protein